jgi:hypothetical protein
MPPDRGSVSWLTRFVVVPEGAGALAALSFIVRHALGSE